MAVQVWEQMVADELSTEGTCGSALALAQLYYTKALYEGTGIGHDKRTDDDIWIRKLDDLVLRRQPGFTKTEMRGGLVIENIKRAKVHTDEWMLVVRGRLCVQQGNTAQAREVVKPLVRRLVTDFLEGSRVGHHSLLDDLGSALYSIGDIRNRRVAFASAVPVRDLRITNDEGDQNQGLAGADTERLSEAA